MADDIITPKPSKKNAPMSIDEFSDSKGLNKVDRMALKMKYGNTKKSDTEWTKEVSDDIEFNKTTTKK